MPMKKYKPEQIVTLLRQVEVGIANGKTTPQACKEADIMDQPEFLYQASERVYITAIGCEIGLGGTRELQAAGAGGL